MMDKPPGRLPLRALPSLGIRQEKFPREGSPKVLRTQVEELQLADLVGDLGVLSRRAIDLKLRKMAERMKRGNLDEVPGLAIAYADIDGLKQINDAGGRDRGHDMGDAALVNVAEQISKVRPSDIVARLGGGDEFGVIMQAASPEQARMLMVDGREDREGFIPRTQKAVEAGREKLKAHFGERWAQDTPEKKPGNVTMGWTFLSREEFQKLYSQWQTDVAEGVTGVGDFATYVFGGADKAMFARKS